MKKNWLKRQNSDPFVKKRIEDGARSRAFYKFDEIDSKDRVLKKGDYVIDLGASPGGWSEYASKKVGKNGSVFAIDTREMKLIRGVNFLRGDCTELETQEKISSFLQGKKVDLVISDLAPNLSGITLKDEAMWVELVGAAEVFVQRFLKVGGHAIIKLFQFQETDQVVRSLGSSFSVCKRRKPAASRQESREFFAVCKNFCGEN